MTIRIFFVNLQKTTIMNLYKSIIPTYIAILSLLGLAGCGRGGGTSRGMTDEEEEAVFEEVYVPGAEGRYDDAIRVADSILSHVAMSDTLRAYIMIERGTALFNKGDMPSAKAYTDTMIRFGRESGIDQLIIQGEQNKGICFRREEMYDSAAACFSRAMDLVLMEDDPENEQTLSDYLGVMYAELGRYDEAIRYGRRSLELAEEMDDKTAMVSSASTLAGSMLRSGDTAGALDILKKEIPMSSEVAPVYQVKFYTPLVQSCIDLDSLELARQYLVPMKKAASMLPEGHQGASAPLMAEALLLAKEGRHAERWKVLCRIDSIGVVGKAADVIAAERAQCLADMGRWQEAYARMETAYDTLRASARSDVSQQLSEFSVRYETLSKQYEIERLQRRNLGYAVIALACLIVALASVGTVGWVRRRARTQRQREYIRGLEQERTRLARELHDGLAGDLTGLRLMMPGRTDEENIEAVREMAAKVRDMSHQLMAPEFGEYPVTFLVGDLLRKFGQAHPEVEFSTGIEGHFDWKSLSAETNYEIYRIVQECVSNALRHAGPHYVEVCFGGDNGFDITITNDGISHGGDSGSKIAVDGETGIGIGMRTVRARAELIDAQVTTAKKDNDTFTIRIRQKR